jgi:hypothetical protein
LSLDDENEADDAEYDKSGGADLMHGLPSEGWHVASNIRHRPITVESGSRDIKPGP